MRLALTLLLLLLVSCADTPSKPTTSGGSSSGSGKIVTATPEESFECDDDLILEPHLPEECIPPEPPDPLVQKPVEPPKPDPIVGTYHLYPTSVNWPQESVLRVYADGSVKRDKNRVRYRWKKNDDLYQLFMVFENNDPEAYHFSLKYQDEEGEPEISTTDISYRAPWNYFEGIKLSSDPNFHFDLFHLGIDKGEKWVCKNVGRGEEAGGYIKWRGYPPSSSITLQNCEAQCRPAQDWLYSHQNWWKNSFARGNKTEEEAKNDIKRRRALATCPQDRR